MVQDIVELESGDHKIGKTDCLTLQVLESDRLSRKCGSEIELWEVATLSWGWLITHIPSHHPLFTKFCIPFSTNVLAIFCISIKGVIEHFPWSNKSNEPHLRVGSCVLFRVSWHFTYQHSPSLHWPWASKKRSARKTYAKRILRSSTKVGCLKKIIRDISRLFKHVQVCIAELRPFIGPVHRVSWCFTNSHTEYNAPYSPSPPFWVPERGVGNEESPDISHCVCWDRGG